MAAPRRAGPVHAGLGDDALARQSSGAPRLARLPPPELARDALSPWRPPGPQSRSVPLRGGASHSAGRTVRGVRPSGRAPPGDSTATPCEHGGGAGERPPCRDPARPLARAAQRPADGAAGGDSRALGCPQGRRIRRTRRRCVRTLQAAGRRQPRGRHTALPAASADPSLPGTCGRLAGARLRLQASGL